MSDDNISMQSLPWTGERYLPNVHGSIELEHLHRYLFARQFSLDKRVLDIASGEGYGSALLAQCAANVVGVDISAEAVAHARKKYQADNLEFKIGSCSAIPLADNSVDIVVSFETIEHHYEHDAMMREIKRVLVPGGQLIISSPDRLEYSDRPVYDNPYHVKELYRGEFKSLLDAYFKHHNIAGQRIVYGSAIFDENGSSKIRSFDLRDKSLLAAPGISRAVYLVAVASDADLPVSESGILEQPFSESDSVQEGLRQIASLSHSLDDRGGLIDRLNQVVAEREGQIASLNHSLDDRGGLIDRLNQIVAEREGQIASLNHSLDDRGGLIDRLNQIVAEREGQIASLNHQIEEILSSTSWRITKSLRWIKRVVNRAQQHRQSLTMGRIARYVLRKLHVSTSKKNAIKDVVYQYAGRLFKEEPSYRMWKAMRRTELTMSDGRENGISTLPLHMTPRRATNILIIDDRTPTPDRDSGSLDVYFFMKAFIELGYNTTFIPDDLKPLGHYTDNLRSLGVRCLTREDINSIESFLREEGCGFDVVLLYRVHTARMHAPNVRKYAPNAKIVFDTVDLHFLREERQAVLDNSSEAQARARYTKEAEFEMMRVADATIVLSSVERDIVVQHDSSINVFTIPYMRDIPGRKSGYAERRDIVFIGGFLHLPNVDCINYFVHDVWPTVRTALPGAKFIILGSSPPDEILGLGDIDPRIQVVGFVEDIDPYFNTCRISIAPIRYGAGIKGKIGTSASYGVPCVASSLAVEGMGLVDGVDVLVADTAEMFAEKVIKLYNDETLWKQLSNSSLDFMQRNYSYKTGKANLQRLLNSLTG